jgi:hypothetical protein
MVAVGRVSEIVLLLLSIFIAPGTTKSLIDSTFRLMEAERGSVLSMERCIGATDGVPKLSIAGPIFWLWYLCRGTLRGLLIMISLPAVAVDACGITLYRARAVATGVLCRRSL